MTEVGTEIVLKESTIAAFAQMLTALEEYDAGGLDEILGSIFAAKTVDEFNAVLGAERALPNNREVKVERVRYARSDFTQGLPFYAVLDGVDIKTGEARQWVTGATTVVGVLVHAAASGLLPIVGHAEESDKPTKNNYHPVNWVMSAIGGNGQQALAAEKAAK